MDADHSRRCASGHSQCGARHFYPVRHRYQNLLPNLRLLRQLNIFMKATFRAIILSSCLVGPLSFGEIPEPDNVLYGAIYFGTNQITAADTDIVIEARRTPAG